MLKKRNIFIVLCLLALIIGGNIAYNIHKERTSITYRPTLLIELPSVSFNKQTSSTNNNVIIYMDVEDYYKGNLELGKNWKSR